jgi:integrase
MVLTVDLAEYLDQWMVRQRLRLRPRTWDAYRLTIATYIAPTLGDVELAELGPAAIEHLYGELLDHGGRNDRPLALATIRHVHGVLHKALADAVRTELLSANPADRVALPRRDLRDDGPATVQAWTAEEARRFLHQTRGDQHGALWAVALGTGMRRGELLGLRWRDVDLDDRLVTVTGALTKGRGPLPSRAGPARGHEDEQRPSPVHRRAHRRGAGTRTTRRRSDHGRRPQPRRPRVHRGRRPAQPATHHPPLPPDGPPARRRPGPYAPDSWVEGSTSRSQGDRRRRSSRGDVRHTHATLLLAAGVPIKVVSERLGHATIAMTLDVYAHVLPAMDREAAERFGALLDA